MSQKSATVALVNNNRLLLLKRGSTAPWNPDKYCLPGGKLEDNESLGECAVRELYEETDIALNVSDLIPITISYPKYSKVVFLCSTECEIYSVKLNWEHTTYLWSTLSDADVVPLVPGLRTTIKTLCDRGLLI